MGSFVFKWEHPASEVYVTGTFDDWRKSERLEKVGDIFEKNVTLSSADQKIYYKFVVDGNWVTDHTAPQENDESGNLNNVLTVDRIVKHQPESTGIMSGVAPTSTTANLAKDVPLESSANKSASSDLPGTFPETPAATEEKGHFSVNPLPAADGAVNPIKLAPGEKVPDSSTFTENTITSGVRHDDPDMLEELKKSVEKEKTENEQPFGVSPLPAFPGAINPIKVAPGEKLPDSSTLTGNTIQSTVKIDGDSYEKSGGVGNAPVLPPVVTPQSEREKNGTGVLDLPPISKNLIPESSLPIDTPGAGISDTGPTIQSAGPESTTFQLAANVPLEPARVPDIVKESQERAGVDPEASAIAEEVKEKSAVEKELGSKVPEAKSTSEGVAGEGTIKSENSVTAGEAGAAVLGAATALGGAAVVGASGLASNVASKLPESVTSKLSENVQASIDNVNAESDTKVAAPAQDTPAVVKESIAESGQAPEAASNDEAVTEKKAVEKELLSEVKKENSTGEPAPKITSEIPSSKLTTPPSSQGVDSRDVSPGTIPGSRAQTHTDGPNVTTGVGSSSTAEKSTPAKTESPAQIETPKKSGPTVTPAKATPESSKTTDTPASTSASQKKKNRASAFFSKIKAKLSDK